MPQFTSFGNDVYSIDLMHGYNDVYKPKFINMNIDVIPYDLTEKIWDNSVDNTDISPWEVLHNPSNYTDHADRIAFAKLKYPILMTNNNVIIDGMHRFVRALMLKKKKIRVIKYDDELMKKFLLNTKGDMTKNYAPADFIKMFYDRFIKK